MGTLRGVPCRHRLPHDETGAAQLVLVFTDDLVHVYTVLLEVRLEELAVTLVLVVDDSKPVVLEDEEPAVLHGPQPGG